MSLLDADYLYDEAAAYVFVESRLWAHGRVCPHCNTKGRSAPLRGMSTRLGTYKCYACSRPFTVKIGTIFENSHIPLYIWLQAIFLIATSKTTPSATQLQQILGISPKSALFLLRRISAALDEQSFRELPTVAPQVDAPPAQSSALPPIAPPPEYAAPRPEQSVASPPEALATPPLFIPDRAAGADRPARPLFTAPERIRLWPRSFANHLAAHKLRWAAALVLAAVSGLAAQQLRHGAWEHIKAAGPRFKNSNLARSSSAPFKRVASAPPVASIPNGPDVVPITLTNGVVVIPSSADIDESTIKGISATPGTGQTRHPRESSDTGASPPDAAIQTTPTTILRPPERRLALRQIPPKTSQILPPSSLPPPPPIVVVPPRPAVSPSIATPPPGPAAAPPGPAAQPAPQAEQQQVVLRGLRLLDNVAKVEADGGQARGIVIEHIALLETPRLRRKLQPFLGQPISQPMLQAITTLITDWYREHDHPFVDVVFPAGQDITNGTLQLVVTESRAGKILATGNHWFSSALLTDQVRLAPGDRISLSRLEADKSWLNQNPFRVVNIVAQRSSEPGYTDFTVETVQENLPLQVRAGFSNNGVPIIGRDIWSYGLDWGNALWLDQQFSYTFTSSLPVWRWGSAMNLQEHTASYTIPLPWHDKLVILGDYAKAKPQLGPDLGVTGINSQLSARYVLALPSTDHLSQSLQLGFDFKSSNNNLQFGGTQVLDVTTQIYQFSVLYSGALKDSLGQTSLDNNLVFSPGNFNSHNSDADFGVQAAFAKARYIYDNLAITRLTGLPQDAEWVDQLGWLRNTSSLTRITAQISDVNLLPSEQLGLGGTDTIPGYDPRKANGSQGVFVSEEVLLPAFSVAQQVFHSTFPDQVQFSGFWTYGEVRDKKTAPDALLPPDLESAGIGLRFIAGHYLNLRANYGWQLRKLPGADNHGAFGHVAVTATY